MSRETCQRLADLVGVHRPRQVKRDGEQSDGAGWRGGGAGAGPSSVLNGGRRTPVGPQGVERQAQHAALGGDGRSPAEGQAPAASKRGRSKAEELLGGPSGAAPPSVDNPHGGSNRRSSRLAGGGSAGGVQAAAAPVVRGKDGAAAAARQTAPGLAAAAGAATRKRRW